MAAYDALDSVFSTAVKACEEENGNLDEELYDRLVPAATLRIETTDPVWCEHLEVGMVWDVYAFDYAAGSLL